MKGRITAIYFGLYFDDVFGICATGERVIREEETRLIEQSNCSHINEHSFEFATMEQLERTPMSFLDIELYTVRKDNGKLLGRP